MDLLVVQLHKHPEYIQKCCDLINSEWKRSNTARLRSLESSSDRLPTSLILLKGNVLLGHVKLSPIPNLPNGCFLESVIIDKKQRGKGLGSILMIKTEVYCRNFLHLHVIYLSTKGQEEFYSKLGYTECMPISIYGGFIGNIQNSVRVDKGIKEITPNLTKNIPVPPALPVKSFITSVKTFMRKEIT